MPSTNLLQRIWTLVNKLFWLPAVDPTHSKGQATYEAVVLTASSSSKGTRLYVSVIFNTIVSAISRRKVPPIFKRSGYLYSMRKLILIRLIPGHCSYWYSARSVVWTKHFCPLRLITSCPKSTPRSLAAPMPDVVVIQARANPPNRQPPIRTVLQQAILPTVSSQPSKIL